MDRRLTAAVCSLLFALAGCAPAETQPTAPPPSGTAPVVSPVSPATPTPSPAAVAAPIWGEQVSECSRSDQTDPDVLLLTGRFALPLIENAAGIPAYEAVNDWYLDLSAGLRSDTLMNEAQAADDYAASKVMDYPFTPYTDEETYEIKYETPRMVSILRTHYGLTGGVYPSLLFLSDHFDLTTGGRLEFSDIFSDPDRARSVVLEEILRQAAEPRADGLVCDPAAVSAAFQAENFYFTPDGMVFFYQPEVLAPHAAGAAEFTLSYDLLEGLLLSWE